MKRTVVDIEDENIFGSAKERDAFEKKLRPAKRYTLKYLSAIKEEKSKTRYTKSWSQSEMDILLNNSLEDCLVLITTKRERIIRSKFLKITPKPKKASDIGNPLDLNYKNDYSNKPSHLPEVKCFNKKLIRIALRKT